MFYNQVLPGVLVCCGLCEHCERLWQEQAVAKTAQSGNHKYVPSLSQNCGSTALCFFRILEGLAYCTEYLEYAPLRVSPSCWALGLGLSWIPGNILIFFPGSDTMKQCKSCIISLTAHCNSQFVTWHKEFVLHALKMT